MMPRPTPVRYLAILSMPLRLHHVFREEIDVVPTTKKSLPSQAPYQTCFRMRLVARPARGETVSAVDRLVPPRLERNLGDAAALRARRGEHLTRARAAAAAVGRAPRLSRRAAIRAAAGFVGKAFHREKLLFAGGKRELAPAIYAGQHFVCVHKTTKIS